MAAPPRKAASFVLGGAAGVGTAGVVAAVAYAAPSVARLLPPRLRWTPSLSGLGRPDHVALTFDDGPDPRGTPAVLDALARLGWTATFFLLEPMVARSPGLVGELVAAGHEIAVHGTTHHGAIRRGPPALAADALRARDAIAAAAGTPPGWYRPPYGELSLGSLLAARAAQLRLVLWSAWGRDWRADATPPAIVRSVERGVLAGGTVLLHDSDCTSAPSSWRTTVAALPLLADRIAALGLRVGPLREHGVVNRGVQ